MTIQELRDNTLIAKEALIALRNAVDSTESIVDYVLDATDPQKIMVNALLVYQDQGIADQMAITFQPQYFASVASMATPYAILKGEQTQGVNDK